MLNLSWEEYQDDTNETSSYIETINISQNRDRANGQQVDTSQQIAEQENKPKFLSSDEQDSVPMNIDTKLKTNKKKNYRTSSPLFFVDAFVIIRNKAKERNKRIENFRYL